MDLGKHVVDKELLDVHGLRAGKVDDLLLVVPNDAPEGALPEVAAIITGPLALSRHLPRWVEWLARQTYRLLGVADPRPVTLPWSHVTAIDVVVHLDVDRAAACLLVVQDAVARRFICRLPGS
ncbi:MAG TPA: hypothetical protein VK066_04515 [Chloroflexota bacterium]|nr:hypothetical protein [Chloroflexota bacterium]